MSKTCGQETLPVVTLPVVTRAGDVGLEVVTLVVMGLEVVTGLVGQQRPASQPVPPWSSLFPPSPPLPLACSVFGAFPFPLLPPSSS